MDTGPVTVGNHQRGADASTDADEEVRTRIADIHQQIDEYQAERHRRRALGPAWVAHEQQLPQHTERADEIDQQITEQHAAPSHRPADDGLGL